MVLNCLTKFSTILATVSATLSEVSEFFLSKNKGDIEESSATCRFLMHNPYISTILGQDSGTKVTTALETEDEE